MLVKCLSLDRQFFSGYQSEDGSFQCILVLVEEVPYNNSGIFRYVVDAGFSLENSLSFTLKKTYDRVKEIEAGELEEEWGLMKESFVGHASDVCGKRFVGGCMRRGSEWWNEGVKMKVEEKKRAF